MDSSQPDNKKARSSQKEEERYRNRDYGIEKRTSHQAPLCTVVSCRRIQTRRASRNGIEVVCESHRGDTERDTSRYKKEKSHRQEHIDLIDTSSWGCHLTHFTSWVCAFSTERQSYSSSSARGEQPQWHQLFRVWEHHTKIQQRTQIEINMLGMSWTCPDPDCLVSPTRGEERPCVWPWSALDLVSSKTLKHKQGEMRRLLIQFQLLLPFLLHFYGKVIMRSSVRGVQPHSRVLPVLRGIQILLSKSTNVRRHMNMRVEIK